MLGTGMHVMAQSRTVRGTVVDDKGNPVMAAFIKTSDDKATTLTDENGNFEIILPEDAARTLVVEATGWSAKTINVTESEEALSITVSGANTLDDVIITSYSTTTKENSVGSASSFGEKRLEKFVITDVSRAIEGAAPGVQVTNGGGAPGSNSAAVRIRGIGSISGSSAPLYVVDGSPFAGDITSINPSDISNVSILKDATATSLYGSRGANGVIVITTKRGKRNGKPQITVDGRVGAVSRSIPNYDVIKDEKEFYELSWDAYRNFLNYGAGYDRAEAGRIASGLNPGEAAGLVGYLGGYNSFDVADNALLDPVTGKIIGSPTLKYHDDWEDELSRVGLRQEYNLGLSGGNESTDYYFSLGYLKEKGFVKFSDYERITGRGNINSTVNSWLSVGMNFSGTYGSSNFVENGGTAGGYNPFFAALTNAPIYPVYYRNENNELEIDPLTGENKFDWGAANIYPSSSIGTRATLPNANVLGSLSLDKDKSQYLNLTAVPYIQIKFLKNFTFKTDLNFNYYAVDGNSYNNPFYGQFSLQGGVASRSASTGLIYTFRQMLTWERQIGDHYFNAVAAHENYDLRTTGVSASRAGVAFPGNYDLTGAATPLGSASAVDLHRIESYLAKADYTFKNKYLFTASVRQDGSSRLAAGNGRWGSPFWAVGAGWKINQEEFLRDVKWLDMLKLKMSYGTQGNESLGGYYSWQSLYRVDFPNGSAPGAIVSTIGNRALTWETSSQFNAGVEFGLFGQGRVTGEITYFVRGTSNMLYNLPVALSHGISTRPANTLSMQNKGIEFSLNADVVRSRNFTWNMNLNLTHFKNEITKMPTGIDSIITGQYMYKEGHSIYDFYLVESSGVNPTNGDELYKYVNDEGAWADTSNYAFANGRGRTYQGSSLPDLMGQLTNTFTYKGFDLSFMIAFNLGGKFYDGVYQDLMSPGTVGNNWHRDMLNRWTEENPNGELPRVEYQNQDIGGQSTRFLTSASFLNIRSINLGYTLPTKWIAKTGMSSLRIYASADNVWLFSNRQGMNPQGSFSGLTDFNYTPSRIIMAGVKVGL